MSEENEIIAQEIYEYYQKKQENLTDNSSDKNEASAANTISDLKDSAKNLISQKIKNIFWDRKNLMILSAVFAALFAVLCGYVIGLLIPKNSGRVAEITEQLKEESEQFQKALSDNSRLNGNVEDLYDERAQKKAELNSITDYEETRDQAINELYEISSQLEDLNNQIAEKENKVAELDASIKAAGGGEITLSPGMYTVGKQLAAGEYSVTGNGSILVSDSQSKLKINTKLTSSAYTCPLSNGDIIKLETEAKFNPAEE